MSRYPTIYLDDYDEVHDSGPSWGGLMLTNAIRRHKDGEPLCETAGQDCSYIATRFCKGCDAKLCAGCSDKGTCETGLVHDTCDLQVAIQTRLTA